ncbi:MAG: glutamine--tRNA ligase, partial [Opitutales bacterium]
PDGRKVKGTIHWVSAPHALDAEVRLYDRLFATENPDEIEGGDDFTDNLNPDSLETLSHCKLEPSLTDSHDPFQLERLGYFRHDPKDSTSENPVLNRAVPLRDSWAKEQQRS